MKMPNTSTVHAMTHVLDEEQLARVCRGREGWMDGLNSSPGIAHAPQGARTTPRTTLAAMLPASGNQRLSNSLLEIAPLLPGGSM